MSCINETFLRRFSGINSLRLVNGISVDTLKPFTNLTDLRLRNTQSYQGESMQELLAGLPKLQVLKLSSALFPTKLYRCTELQQLYAWEIASPDSLPPSLTKLGLYSMSPNQTYQLTRCLNLLSLRIASGNIAATVLTKMTNLTELYLPSSTQDTFLTLRKLTNLRSLMLPKWKREFNRLHYLTNLHTFAINNDHPIPSLLKLTNLTKLKLNITHGPVPYEALRSYTNLTYLRNSKFSFPICDKNLPSSIRTLKGFPLESTLITHLTDLTHLDISKWMDVPVFGINDPKYLTSLRTLKLSYWGATPQTQITLLTNLTYLEIGLSTLSNTFTDQLPNLKCIGRCKGTTKKDCVWNLTFKKPSET